MAILTLALVTAAIVAAYSSTSAEVVSNSAMRAQDHAYQLAESGLQQFMQRRGEGGFCTNCAADPLVADSEWTRVSLPGGYADVVAVRLRPKVADTLPALFFIRSKGVDTTVKMGGAGITVYATRIVGQYATFSTATIKPLAAWTSFNGIRNNGRALLPLGGSSPSPGTGVDQCGALPILPGFVVPGPSPPDRQYLYTAGNLVNFLGIFATQHPTGFPVGVDSTKMLDTLKRRAGIDWNAIQNYDVIPATVTVPPGVWPTATAFTDTSFWPVIRVKGDATLPRDGRGILIVDGDLTIGSSESWDGIMLVGGKLVTNGSGTIAGVTITGLDRTLPDSVNPPAGHSADNDEINVTSSLLPIFYKRFEYNSCKAARAAKELKVYFAWSNTWLDNVAIW